MTVGADLHRSKALIIQVVREWKANCRRTVIGVVAGVGRPRDDGSGPDGEHVIRARCRGWRWCRRRWWTQTHVVHIHIGPIARVGSVHEELDRNSLPGKGSH